MQNSGDNRRNEEGDGRTVTVRSAFPTEVVILSWLVSHLAEELNIDAAEIDTREPFSSFGVGSAQAIGLAGELEEWLGVRLPATVTYDHPSIEALARHLAELGEVRAPAENARPRDATDPIAVIGIGCRFPKAAGVAAFWRLLCAGEDAIEASRPRPVTGALRDADAAPADEASTGWGGFLDQVDLFDPAFFGISPREAAEMDPQQRLLLEVAWEAIEDAGQLPEKMVGSETGVFIGMSSNDYGRMQWGDSGPPNVDRVIGNAPSVAANRISYLLNLQGPSLVVDTACSSSLVALHLACQSLRLGESHQALVGGVNVLLQPGVTQAFASGGLLAADGRCKAFDARADGYVRSEGAGVVFLKPLARALSDGDAIYAVIRGTAVNNDGRTNGLTAPSQRAQERLLLQALRCAAVEPARVHYVEAQGTGTLIGDAVEAKALGAVLGKGRSQDRPCAIGSVKTNLGHLEAASGMAGLIKVALMLEHRELPASLHFREPNPHVPFATLGIRVQRRRDPWPEDARPAVAGVSGFGFGGTNAHAVMEEPPRSVETPAGWKDTRTDIDLRPQLLLLSAKSPGALDALVRDYRDFLSPHGDGAQTDLSDICYTAALRRTHYGHRLALLGATREQFLDLLAAALRGEVCSGLFRGRSASINSTKLAFVFGGQGEEWREMGRDLFQRETVFRAALERCDAVLVRCARWSLLEEVLADESRSRMTEPELAAPVLFCLQTALVALWQSWGVEPDAVVGCGPGEVSAAHAAGVIDLEQALRIVLRHGPFELSIDRREAPRQEIAETSLHPRQRAVTIASPVLGRIAGSREFDAAYWEKIRNPAEFRGAVMALVAENYRAFLAIGPDAGLSGVISGLLRNGGYAGIVVPSLRREATELVTMLQSLAQLHVAGYPVALERVYGVARRCVSLPSYPWQRQRYWLGGTAPREPQGEMHIAQGNAAPAPVPGAASSDAVAALGQNLLASAPAERYALLDSHVRERIAQVLGADAVQIERFAPLDGLGFDSLKAVELKRRLEEDTGLNLPVTLSWGADFTVANLVDELAERLTICADGSPQPALVDTDRSRFQARTESDPIAAMLEEIEREQTARPGPKT